MTHDEMIAVLAAAKAGKTIQAEDITGQWLDVSNPVFNFGMTNYRVKKEPRVLYVLPDHGIAATEEEEAKEAAAFYKTTYVKYQEVV